MVAAMMIDVPFWDFKNQCDDYLRGEIVDVAPHLAHIATWVVHRHADRIWRITNVETGRCVATCDAGRKSSAIIMAKIALENKTAADMERAYRKAKRQKFRGNV